MKQDKSTQNLNALAGIVFLLVVIFKYQTKIETYFFQFRYNWGEEKVISTLTKNIIPDSLGIDFLSIKTDPNSIDKYVNANQAYCLVANERYYFRATNVLKQKNNITFKGIVWITTPPQISKEEKVNLEMVELNILQKGTHKVMTLGDSQTIWRYAREFRKAISEKNKNVNFVGTQKDVYGFPYSGGVFATSREILEIAKKPLNIDTLILFFGAHDKEKRKEEIIENLRLLRDELKSKEINSIIVISLPNSEKTDVHLYNNWFNEQLETNFQKLDNVHFLEIDEILSHQSHKFLMSDKVHLNRDAYSLLSNMITKKHIEVGK